MIKLKRADEPNSREDGQRFLVERLWPRGVKKTSLQLEAGDMYGNAYLEAKRRANSKMVSRIRPALQLVQ